MIDSNKSFSGALVNAVFLVALCFSITMESLKRFYEPETIHEPKLIFTVGALGLVVNLLGKSINKRKISFAYT